METATRGKQKEECKSWQSERMMRPTWSKHSAGRGGGGGSSKQGEEIEEQRKRYEKKRKKRRGSVNVTGEEEISHGETPRRSRHLHRGGERWCRQEPTGSGNRLDPGYWF